MTDAPDNLVLEHLRAIRSDIAKLALAQEEHIGRTRHVEQSLAILAQSYADIARRLDRHDERLSRIERRLDLVS